MLNEMRKLQNTATCDSPYSGKTLSDRREQRQQGQGREGIEQQRFGAGRGSGSPRGAASGPRCAAGVQANREQWGKKVSSAFFTRKSALQFYLKNKLTSFLAAIKLKVYIFVPRDKIHSPLIMLIGVSSWQAVRELQWGPGQG